MSKTSYQPRHIVFNTPLRYGFVAKFFHWLLALLFFVQMIIGITMGWFTHQWIKGQMYTLHKSLGIVILVLMMMFVLWRLFNCKPHWPATMSNLARVLAHCVHLALYIFFLLMPLTGWIMSCASGHVPNFFWLGKLPLPGVGINRGLAASAAELHYLFSWIIAALVALHAIAAVRHHVMLKDNILRRMWWGS